MKDLPSAIARVVFYLCITALLWRYFDVCHNGGYDPVRSAIQELGNTSSDDPMTEQIKTISRSSLGDAARKELIKDLIEARKDLRKEFNNTNFDDLRNELKKDMTASNQVVNIPGITPITPSTTDKAPIGATKYWNP